MLGQLLERCGQKVQPRAAGHVVEEDGQVRRVRDGQKVPDQALLRGLVVIGRDQQQRVRPQVLGLLDGLHGKGGVVAARARDDGHAPAHALDGPADDHGLLRDVHGGGFARRAADDERVRAPGELIVHQLVQSL